MDYSKRNMILCLSFTIYDTNFGKIIPFLNFEQFLPRFNFTYPADLFELECAPDQ